MFPGAGVPSGTVIVADLIIAFFVVFVGVVVYLGVRITNQERDYLHGGRRPER